MLKELTLKKHSSIVQMSNRVTVQQRKCFNVLLHTAREILEKKPNTQLFQVSLAKVKKLAGVSANNNQEIKQSLKGLVDITVEYNVLNKDKKKVWGAFSLLAQANIIDGSGFLSFQFPLDIHNALLRPDIYVLLDLSVIKGLQSKYSVALYELLKDYKNIKSITMGIENFKNLMGIEKVYRDFTDVRNKVLDPAIAEINAKTDIIVDYEEFAEGRKIVELAFTIDMKESETKTINDKNQEGFISEINTLGVAKISERSKRGKEKIWLKQYSALINNIDNEIKVLWEKVLLMLSREIKEKFFQVYIADLKIVSCIDAKVNLVCKDIKTVIHVDSRYRETIEKAFFDVTNVKHSVTILPTKENLILQ